LYPKSNGQRSNIAEASDCGLTRRPDRGKFGIQFEGFVIVQAATATPVDFCASSADAIVRPAMMTTIITTITTRFRGASG